MTKITLSNLENANSAAADIHLAYCDWATANGYTVIDNEIIPKRNGVNDLTAQRTTSWGTPTLAAGDVYDVQKPRGGKFGREWKAYYYEREGVPYTDADPSNVKFGVNFGSASFAPTAIPRVHGEDYAYTGNSFVDYYADFGCDMIRVAFRWEAIQPNAYADLDSTELARLKSSVDYILSKNMIAVIDVHNYASYKNSEKVNNIDVAYAVFADLWTKLANAFKYDTDIHFDIMNEPTGVTPAQWAGAAQAAITAIRNTGATNKIYLAGTSFSGAHNFISSGWSAVVKDIVDPLDNMTLTVHQYLDSNNSGSSGAVVSQTIGVERLQAVTTWARTNGYKLYLGETNAGARGLLSSGDAYQALKNMFDYIRANDDVWEAVTLWSGGDWWPDTYHFNIEPVLTVDDIRLTLTKDTFD